MKTSSHKGHFSLLTTLQLPITTILLESSTFGVSENSCVAIFLLLRSYISYCHQSLETSVILHMTVAAKLFYCVNCLLFSFWSSSFLLLIPWTIKKIQMKTALQWGLFTAMKCFQLQNSVIKQRHQNKLIYPLWHWHLHVHPHLEHNQHQWCNIYFEK